MKSILVDRKFLVKQRAELKKFERRLYHLLFKQWNIVLLGIGFLLGRAVMLEQVSPFALPFLAVVYHMRRDRLLAVTAALLLGASSSSNGQALWLLCTFLLYFVLKKGIERWRKITVNYVPLIVLMTLFTAEGIRLGVGEWTLYNGVLAMINIVLGVLLTFIFVQSLPVILNRHRTYTLRPEEIVCLIILLASAVTGLTGWQVGELSVVNIVSRFVILLFAFVGGGMLGTTVGVVMGLILSLANQQAVAEISLLAFTGLLAGLFREGKKWGVSIGLVVGTSIFALYTSTGAAILFSLYESLAAVVVFMLTPPVLTRYLSRYIPGTVENSYSQQEYARRVRDITGKKVEQFSEVFSELARSFSTQYKRLKQGEEYLQQFVAEVSETACNRCRKYDECWGKKFYQTYNGITDLVALVEIEENNGAIRVPKSWQSHCIRSKEMMEHIQNQFELYQRDLYWQERLWETRQVVSEQLEGMSHVMLDWAAEIRRETKELSAQEEQIQTALEDLGMQIQRVDVISLDEGNVEIEVTLPNDDYLDSCRKIVAPLLTEIIGEHITVHEKVVPISKGNSFTTVTLGTAQNYEVKAGVATAAKGGQALSGDSYSYTNLGTGKYVVAVSDGMGNGSRAQEESQSALKLLEQLLKSGMEEQTAIRTVNAILGVRSTDEVYATVDLALVDLDTARTSFLKIGSMPSFIKRGTDVITVSANNLPIGILQDIEVEMVTERLMPGDILIMMTDGLFDIPSSIANKEAWMKRAIKEIKTREPQGFADLLLEKVVRQNNGIIADDMTVVVAKVDYALPDWATISVPGMPKINRHQVPLS